MKGQIKLDFVLGVVIFAVLIFFIATQVNTVFTIVATDSKLDTMKARASVAINLLASSEGDPANWEGNPPTAVRPGLSAGAPYMLARAKIDALNTNCNNPAQDLLKSWRLKNYRLTVHDSGSRLLFCGSVGTTTLTSVITRSVLITDGVTEVYGNITLEVWP